MAFIKTHLISLLCGVAALLFIVVGVLGMMSGRVVEAMQTRAGVAGDISRLRAEARNDAAIKDEAERGRRFQEEYDATVEVARRINTREPLMEGVFPSAEREAVVYDFRDAYIDAIRRLPLAQLPGGRLQGGDLPTPAEVREAEEEIADRDARKREEAAEGGPAEKPIDTGRRAVQGDPQPAVEGVGGDMSPIYRGRGMPPGRGGPGAGPPSGVVTGDPETDPVARASVRKAREIRVYVSVAPEQSSFHLSPIWDQNTQPLPEEMWYAQVGLWIQQDVVNAIAELNEEAARQLKPNEAYVENMPVKRLQGIRVLGYWTEREPVYFASLASAAGGGPVGDMQRSFTDRKCNEQFDVVRFRVVAVVDQRELPRLIDRITRQNFYRQIGGSYRVVGPLDQDLQQGYRYGTAPVMRAELDFEGYMARDVYAKLFPAEVRQRLGVPDNK